MDLTNTALFVDLKQRLAWLGQRQEVLAENIANADTPGFRPRDLEPFRFQDLVRGEAPNSVSLERTQPAHLGGTGRSARGFAETMARDPYETSPAGNAVVLEEQMAKVSETQSAHRLMTELYRKHLGLIRLAVGGRH